MAGFKMRRRLVLATIEAAYGDDEAPTPEANAILTRTVQVTPLAGDDIERNLLRAYYGNSQSIAGEKHVELTMEVELAGSGTAGDAPAWGVLLRACGFAETEEAGTEVVYNPITDSEESISCWIHRDGVLHKFTGGRGSVRFNLGVNNIPFMTFTFLGLLGTISNENMPTTADYSPWTAPLPVTNANTTPLTLHGADLSFSEFTLDMAVETVKHMVVGDSSSILIVDRAPSGTAVVEEPDLATLNLYNKARDASLGNLALAHGTVAGNIVEFAAPKIGNGSPTEQDLNGVQMLSLPLTINPDAGNDELVITVK
ncbi:phage tail tube protein [Marinobacter sp.]|uniref:phage tail tube protein n=1 Tax=Marinobacter sp. TaxID=50741 RepID=UPI0034A4050C